MNWSLLPVSEIWLQRGNSIRVSYTLNKEPLKNKTLLTSGDLSSEFKDFINESYPELNCLHAKNSEEVAKLLPEAQIVAGFNFLNEHDIAHLDWIHSFSAGVDSYMGLTIPENCLLSKTTGKMGNRMGEYCLAYILEDLKQMEVMHHNQSLKAWIQLKQARLYHQNIYIIGTGYVGTEIARIFKPLANSLKGINTSGDLKESFDQCVAWNAINEKTIEENSIIINTLPATRGTINLIQKDFFRKLKNCLFINVGRGATVNEDHLQSALAKKYLRKAILDVMSTEPLPVNSNLWHHPQIIITPHISGVTSLSDIMESFSMAYESFNAGTLNELFVDVKRGY